MCAVAGVAGADADHGGRGLLGEVEAVVEPMNGAVAEYVDGALVRSVCTKPPMSPRPEISWRVPGRADQVEHRGLLQALRPSTLMATLPPVSQSVRLVVP